MLKIYNFLSAILADNPLTVLDGSATITTAQLDSIENTIADKDKTINEQITTLAAKDATIADLQAKLEAKPAATTTTVVEDQKPGSEPAPKNEVEAFVDTYNSARALYNEVYQLCSLLSPHQ